jgi:hypothetical protein
MVQGTMNIRIINPASTLRRVKKKEDTPPKDISIISGGRNLVTSAIMQKINIAENIPIMVRTFGPNLKILLLHLQ